MKILKWIGIVLGGLIGLLVIAVLVLYGLSTYRLNKNYPVQVEQVPIPDDAAALARGKYLVENVSPCTGCHTSDLGGEFFLNDPMIGQVYSKNLTTGQGGVGRAYNDEDWVRTLRHGVSPDGKTVMIMPSQNFAHMTDEDLGAVIAYLKTVPPVDRESPEPQFTFPAKLLFALGALGKTPAEIIEQENLQPAEVTPGVNAAYGEYLSYLATCRDCHGPDLNGGTAGPGEPFAPNLTPGGELIGWSAEDFLKAIKTGVKPSGSNLNEAMPWQLYSGMTDDDLQALWMYLHSLPALETAPQ